MSHNEIEDSDSSEEFFDAESTPPTNQSWVFPSVYTSPSSDFIEFSFRKIQNLSKNQFIFPEPRLDLTDDDDTLRETTSSSKTTSPTNARHKNQESFVEQKPMVSDFILFFCCFWESRIAGTKIIVKTCSYLYLYQTVTPKESKSNLRRLIMMS